jgi:8-oxo-dGTP diphosphatase
MPTVGVFAAIFDEQGRILCVRLNYGPKSWTIPGGRVESGESLIEALEREVQEESGYHIQARQVIGAYSSPYKDDLGLTIRAEIVDRGEWQPNGEISELGFFGKDELPQPMHPHVVRLILDAFEGQTGIMRVFNSQSNFS